MADLNRQDLTRSMVEQVDGLTHALAAASLDALLSSVAMALAQHQSITLSGFGRFKVRYRKPRLGVHPRTRQPMTIAGAYVPAFEPSPALCQRVQTELPTAVTPPVQDSL